MSTSIVETNPSLTADCTEAGLTADYADYTDRRGIHRDLRPPTSDLCLLSSVLCLILLLAASSVAGPVPGQWLPIFKGIDHAVGTNNPSVSGNFPRLQVVHCVRIDLTDPDIRLFTTPATTSYQAEYRETLTLSVPDFLSQYGVQIASDANFYNASPGGSDPTSEGLPCEVYGLQISTGVVVSAQTSSDMAGDPRTVSLLFDPSNRPFLSLRNLPPGTNTAGMYTAVTGFYPVVSNGVDISASAVTNYPDPYIHGVQPRTAFGVSQDNRYLYIMTIDGRQTGYSDGALDNETAYWIMQFGAWTAINMDGGGSTALYRSDTAGTPVGLNHSSYLAAYGRERYIGSHFGVYAKPAPGMINDIQVLPDDTAATITWSTLIPLTSQVSYGLTPIYDHGSAYYPTLVTNHALNLNNLTPGTGYYFKILGSVGALQYSSSNYFFVTTNYLITNFVFDVTNTWIYATNNLDGINWTATNYDDSGWTGSGPGLLWVDTRGFPNPNITEPMNTQMPADASTGFPFITYYFRTHFPFAGNSSSAYLFFHDFIDDGAIFYLNGAEIHRLRMAAAPTPIYNSTLAIGYPCTGDATCPDDSMVSSGTNLVAGDNVLAVEVHNYNAGSPDITFGTGLSVGASYVLQPQLNIIRSNSVVTLSWNRGGFNLQQSASPAGPWVSVLGPTGPIVTSPFITNASSSVFYRLKK